MNSGKTIFAQLMDFLPPYEFRRCVDRYNCNHKVISFSCWDQYLLCSRGNREENLESGPEPLYNSTDSESDPLRKRTILSTTFKYQPHKPGGPTQQPIESILLTLGQQ